MTAIHEWQPVYCTQTAPCKASGWRCDIAGIVDRPRAFGLAVHESRAPECTNKSVWCNLSEILNNSRLLPDMLPLQDWALAGTLKEPPHSFHDSLETNKAKLQLEVSSVILPLARLQAAWQLKTSSSSSSSSSSPLFIPAVLALILSFCLTNTFLAFALESYALANRRPYVGILSLQPPRPLLRVVPPSNNFRQL